MMTSTPLAVRAAPTPAVSSKPPIEISRLGHPRMRVWLLWLAIFYSAWVALQLTGAHWPKTLLHWPIALAMALGSFVAGSTPMGGGTVGFPVLVLLFDLPPSLGRNFGMVIQSVGMTSATIFILCRRSPIEQRVLPFGVAGAAVGLLAGTFWIAPRIPDDLVKLTFACLWASFGLLTLAKNREMCAFDSTPEIPLRAAAVQGSLVGVAGGVTTALTGVGIDMLLYTLLVLRYRMDLKTAVPTSVVIMAIASIMGTALHLAIGDLDVELFYNWLAASPVVILGAPLGAFFVSVIPRVATLYFVALLCLVQFAWAIYQVAPSAWEWAFVAAVMIAASLVFVLLYRRGLRAAVRRTC